MRVPDARADTGWVRIALTHEVVLGSLIAAGVSIALPESHDPGSSTAADIALVDDLE